MKSINTQEIIKQLGGELYGVHTDIKRVAPLDTAQESEISFLSNPKYKSQLQTTQAGVIIIKNSIQDLPNAHNYILVDDPYLYFAQVARLFHPTIEANGKQHPTASIEYSAKVPSSCDIGANVYIGKNVVLGEKCRILAGAVIEDDCTLGDACVIHPNVTLYQGVKLGQRVEIHAGTVIGADGFGLAWTGQNWFKIPQTGAVQIGNDVEIGANSNIDRGALEDTWIGDGVKIDNQVQIGHNCKIGHHTAIAACTGISGSTKIGNSCIIGGAAMFVGHIEIVDGTIIGGGTAVTHSIHEAGHYATCYPIQTHKEWLRNAVHIRHLNEMHKKIKQLEKQMIENLKNQDNKS